MLECAMQVRADHATAADTVDAAVTQPRERRDVFARIERSHPEMDLVPTEPRARGRGRCDRARLLVAAERRLGWKQPQSLNRSRGRLHPIRIVDHSSEHLIAAAD